MTSFGSDTQCTCNHVAGSCTVYMYTKGCFNAIIVKIQNLILSYQRFGQGVVEARGIVEIFNTTQTLHSLALIRSQPRTNCKLHIVQSM